MKTFETEKHNIPKGATHYWNETCSDFFAWWNDDTKEMLCPDNSGSWHKISDIPRDKIYEIPKAKPCTKAEFVKCEYSREWKAVRHYNEVGELFVVDCNGNYTNVNDIGGTWYEVVCKNYKELYIKVETEIDERQEFIDGCMLVGGLRARGGASKVYGNLYDSGKFKLVDSND